MTRKDLYDLLHFVIPALLILLVAWLGVCWMDAIFTDYVRTLPA